MKGLECLSFEEGLREPGLLSLKKRRLEGEHLTKAYRYLKGRMQIRQSHSLFSSAQWQKKKALSTNWDVGFCLNTRQHFFTACVLWSVGLSCLEAVWSPPWRFSKATWLWAWAFCSGWPSGAGVGQNELYRHLPSSTILWLCEVWWVCCRYISPVHLGL